MQFGNALEGTLSAQTWDNGTGKRRGIVTDSKEHRSNSRSPRKDRAARPHAGSDAKTPAASRVARASTKRSFPVVGIGASAGGLEAVSQLLSRLPAETGIAYVLVQHLSPQAPAGGPSRPSSRWRLNATRTGTRRSS